MRRIQRADRRHTLLQLVKVAAYCNKARVNGSIRHHIAKKIALLCFRAYSSPVCEGLEPHQNDKHHEVHTAEDQQLDDAVVYQHPDQGYRGPLSSRERADNKTMRRFVGKTNWNPDTQPEILAAEPS